MSPAASPREPFSVYERRVHGGLCMLVMSLEIYCERFYILHPVNLASSPGQGSGARSPSHGRISPVEWLRCWVCVAVPHPTASKQRCKGRLMEFAAGMWEERV